jgi:acyl-CoA thioesterase FadM
MNLYLRLLKLLLLLPFVAPRGVFDESRTTFRVWPNDCDLNLHMNNGRYLAFMDLGRVHLLRQVRLLGRLVRTRWAPVMAAAEINFLRPLRPFQKFELVTRVLTWDAKYLYLEHRIESGDELYALATVRGLFLRHGRAVGPDEAARVLGVDASPPPMPALVRHWKELTTIKKEQTARHA